MKIPPLLSRVLCPSDMGELPYKGTVLHVGSVIHTNHLGQEFVWVTVRKDGSTYKFVWPSNRLEKL